MSFSLVFSRSLICESDIFTTRVRAATANGNTIPLPTISIFSQVSFGVGLRSLLIQVELMDLTRIRSSTAGGMACGWGLRVEFHGMERAGKSRYRRQGRRLSHGK